jgi:hypothetical protein
MSLGSFRLNRELMWAPLLLGLYTAVVTAASHYEDKPAGGAGRWVLFGAAAGLPVILVGVALTCGGGLVSWALLVLLILATSALFIMTLTRVTFASVRKAIGISIMLIIVFDAAIVFGARPAPVWLGLVTLAAIVPTVALARAVSPS